MADASVLILDDEANIVELCQRLLSGAGYAVTASSAPQDGRRLLDEQAFDLLLVDIRMPGEDGFAVIEHARNVQPDIAVVIMTGYGTLETAIHALRQGADGLILKPFEGGEELVHTAQEALDARRRRRENARLRAIRPLLDMTETLFSETRLDVLESLILDAIRDHLHCEHAAIYRRAPGGALLKPVSSVGTVPLEDYSRAESGVVGRADHWQVPIWLNRSGPGDAELKDTLDELGLDALICTPVLRGTSAMVFFAGRSPGQPAFQIADIELFAILARQAHAALENARLYDDLRTQVRQAEASQRALIQAEKMAAVGRLTASIAHEINNPLQGLENCLHLARREELPVEKRAEYLDMASEELERLMTTVQRMLDYYRPGALDRSPADLNQLLHKTHALLEKQLRESNVSVDFALADALPPVPVVANQMQQVFFNLMINAMEAMPQGGTLHIASHIEPGIEGQEQVAMLFSDDGAGIASDEAASVFEPFYTTKDKGSGLGLSVSYGILTAHGGSLELLPVNGRGACFRVLLPLKQVALSPQA